MLGLHSDENITYSTCNDCNQTGNNIAVIDQGYSEIISKIDDWFNKDDFGLSFDLSQLAQTLSKLMNVYGIFIISLLPIVNILMNPKLMSIPG